MKDNTMSLKTQFASVTTNLLFLLCQLRNINCDRSKRTLAFTNGNSFGYLAAVAIPVDLPNRNIYVAFNLETNYGLPSNDTHYNLIKKWNLNGMFSDISSSVTHVESARRQRSLYSRVNFYRSVTGYMELFGMNGTHCLLRTICEVSTSKLYATSGILGSVFHVLFMPTSSVGENIPKIVYEAEKNGYKNKCSNYTDACPQSILNKISMLM